jgi:hypothetical protein
MAITMIRLTCQVKKGRIVDGVRSCFLPEEMGTDLKSVPAESCSPPVAVEQPLVTDR